LRTGSAELFFDCAASAQRKNPGVCKRQIVGYPTKSGYTCEMAEQTEGGRMQAFDLKLADKTFGEIQSFGVWLDKEPTRTVWFHNMLLCLINALVREYRNLVIGYKKSTPLLASACRNMLELNIYTKYAFIKGSNARDLVDDRWIDAIEIFKSFRNWVRFHDPGMLTPGIDETIRNFETVKAKQGITRTGYLRMKKMASDVNFREEYEHMNKVASKLVPPPHSRCSAASTKVSWPN